MRVLLATDGSLSAEEAAWFSDFVATHAPCSVLVVRPTGLRGINAICAHLRRL